MDKINSNIYKRDYARFNFREEFSNSCNLNDKKTKNDKIEELANKLSNIDKVNDKYHSIKLYINDKLVENPSLDIIEKFSLQKMIDDMKKRCNPNEADYKKHGWNRNHYSYMCPCGSCKHCNNLVSKRFCADLVNQPINYFEEKTMPVNEGARKCVDNACRHPNVICKDCSKKGVNTGVGFVDKAVDSTAKTFEDGWKYVKGGVEDITKWASNTASDVGGGVVQTISTAERVSNEIKNAAKYGTKEVIRIGNELVGGIEDINSEIVTETAKAMIKTGKVFEKGALLIKDEALMPLADVLEIWKCGDAIQKNLDDFNGNNTRQAALACKYTFIYFGPLNFLMLMIYIQLFSMFFPQYMGKYSNMSKIAPPGYFDFSRIIKEYNKILESKTEKLDIELNEEYEKIINEVYDSFEKTESKEELKEKIEEFKLNYKEGKYSSLTKESTFSAHCVDFDLLGNDKQKEELKNRSEFDIEKKMLCSGESKSFNKYTVVRSIHNVITPSEYNNIIRYTNLLLDNYKPIDCEGSYKPCNEECNMEFEAYQEPKFGGKECPSSIKCLPGEDKCPNKPIDCQEAYGKCRNVNGECMKRNVIYQSAKYGGKACKNEDWQKCDKEDEGCPVNCVGSWDKCKLKKLNNGDNRCVRTFKIKDQSKFGGSFCDSVNNEIQLCKSGEGDCPPDIDCKGKWSRCNKNCKKIFKIITPKSGNGYECRYRNGQTERCKGDECKTESKLNRPKIEKPKIFETEYDFTKGSVNIASDGSMAPVSTKKFTAKKENNLVDEPNSNNKLITYLLLLLVILILISSI